MVEVKRYMVAPSRLHEQDEVGNIKGIYNFNLHWSEKVNNQLRILRYSKEFRAEQEIAKYLRKISSNGN